MNREKEKKRNWEKVKKKKNLLNFFFTASSLPHQHQQQPEENNDNEQDDDVDDDDVNGDASQSSDDDGDYEDGDTDRSLRKQKIEVKPNWVFNASASDSLLCSLKFFKKGWVWFMKRVFSISVNLLRYKSGTSWVAVFMSPLILSYFTAKAFP